MLFPTLREIVLECEQLGYHSVWIDDHLMYGKNPVLECWTTLAALASVTTRMRLGTMVTSNGFRNSALLAKMVATVDVISGGRLEFGIGAGVQKQEHEAYGFPFPEVPVRVERLKESLEIIKKLWKESKATYKGKHFRIADAVCEPKPIQKPHPPITIGGCGEKHTLKVTAQYADRFDFGYLPTLDTYKHKLQVLENHCKVVHRNFQDIEKSCWPSGQILLSSSLKEAEKNLFKTKPAGVSLQDYKSYTFAGTPEECSTLLQPYIRLGVTHFMLFFGDLPDTDGLRLFAQTVAQAVEQSA